MEANGVFAEIQPGLRTVANPLTVAGVEKTKPGWRLGWRAHSRSFVERWSYRRSDPRLVRTRRALDGSKQN